MRISGERPDDRLLGESFPSHPIAIWFRSKLSAVYKAACFEALFRKFLASAKKLHTVAFLLDVAQATIRRGNRPSNIKVVNLHLPGRISNRFFAVRYGTDLSTSHTAVEGLPQGFALSPLLFNVCVQDLPTFSNIRLLNLLQFADDTAIVASGRNLETTVTKIEKALQQVIQYMSK